MSTFGLEEFLWNRTKTRGFMKIFRIFLAVLLTFLWISPLWAGGTYYIDKDEDGVYIQTDEDGAWYVDRGDLKALKVGEKGTYSIRTDHSGTYMKTDRHGKFYIDPEEDKNLEQEIGAFNREQERLAEQTEVIIKGNQVLVPVIVGYGENETEALLLLDTGASIIALHSEIADQLDITQKREAKFMGVGGKTITTHITKLSYIQVGPFKIEDIYAGVIEHEGPPVNYQGLLGMNFLRNIDYRIDFDKQVIEWK
jgi:clan AA aspartic protease (TIGR02281 family)